MGSTYQWGGGITGAGRITHEVLESPTRLVSRIEFTRPTKSLARVTFAVARQGNGSVLTWTMEGKVPWNKIWMKRTMDAYIGMDYERGLKMLKDWVESGNIPSKVNIHGKQNHKALQVAGAFRTCPMKQIGVMLEPAWDEVREKFQIAGAPTDGERVVVYRKFDMKQQRVDFIAGFSVPRGMPCPAGLTDWSKPAGRVFRVEHIGSHEHLSNGWAVANQHCQYLNLKQSKEGTYEVYNSPDEVALSDKEHVTDIYLPLK